jgi:ABC-2 type transport system ATP-binding protein
MLRLIREIRDTRDIHLIISSHLLRDVEECCDEVLILKDGQIASYCNLEEERRANRKFLELETVGAGDDFRREVESLGAECDWMTQGRVRLVLPEEMETNRLYHIAARQQVQIRKLSYRRDSLEDIFLKAMDGKEAAHGRL